MKEIIISGYIPGAVGRVAALHAEYYGSAWGFGQFFDAKVATELSEFMMHFDEKRDGFWVVGNGGRVEGAIAIDGAEAATEGAHLRWFILAETMRGQGMGHRLLAKAITFCRARSYRQIYLWTFRGLQPARHLYEKFGFELVEQRPGMQWGKEVLEQKFILVLPSGL